MKSKTKTHSNSYFYDEYSSTYDETRKDGVYRLLNDIEMKAVRSLAIDAKVLELGTGTGLIQAGVDRLSDRCYGLDVSFGMLKYAKTRALKVVCGDILHSPFPDNYFDVVYSMKVLPHIGDIRRAVQEISRLLRPGGTCILEFYNCLSLRYLVRVLRKPSKISENVSEEDLYVRFDHHWKIREYLTGFQYSKLLWGVRIFGIFAPLYRVRILGAALVGLDKMAAGTPLKLLAGHLIYAAVKNQP
jgi:ubiquinone/menaquinone biosynthesis C-methylase UbiE